MDLEKKWQEKFSLAAITSQNDWDAAIWSGEGFLAYQEYFWRYFKEMSKNKRTKTKALDIGCGPGNYSIELAKKGFLVKAMDFSEPMLARAKVKAQKQGVADKIDFLAGDIYKLPFLTKSFDVILCLGVFQTLSLPEKAIKQLQRVLKKQGRAFLTCLNKYSIKSLFLSQEKKKDLVFLSPWQFKKLLQANGFEKVKIKGIYFFPKKLGFLTALIFQARIYKFFNFFFPIFCFLSHSFYIEAQKSSNGNS